MGQTLRKSLGLVQCAALACALLLLGFSPDTGAAGAGGVFVEPVAEERHSHPHEEDRRVGDKAPAPGHCHPGLDCALAAVVVGGPELIARSGNVTREPGFRDLELTGGTPSFDPPPPRWLS